MTAQISSQLANDLVELIAANFELEASKSGFETQYSPHYRLAFSLMDEDASEGGSPSGWDVEAAIASMFFFLHYWVSPLSNLQMLWVRF